MIIDSYEFGRIVIDGVSYEHDVMIFTDKVVSWWRKRGHLLQIDDIREAIDRRPEVILIGTGFSGMLEVPKAVISEISSAGIQVIVGKTLEIVEKYNDMAHKRNVIAALHLTC